MEVLAHIAGIRVLNASLKGLPHHQALSHETRIARVAGKTLTMWGLAFKANTDDMREAASITIINELTAKGMKIRAFDPVAADNARSIFADNKLVEIVDDQYAACQGAQGLMVVTEWNQFRNPDFEKVRGLLTAPLLFDGRNLYSPSAMAERGFAYFCIGRALLTHGRAASLAVDRGIGTGTFSPPLYVQDARYRAAAGCSNARYVMCR